jgi:hypothetical protein
MVQLRKKINKIVWPQKFGSRRQPGPPVSDLNRAKFLFTHSPAQPDEGGSHRSATSNSAIKGRWTTGDISVFAFTLSLVLFGTIFSAHTDRPVFWLLVGPGPIAIGFTLITFLRQVLGKRHGLPAVEQGDRRGRHTNKLARGAWGLSGET